MGHMDQVKLVKQHLENQIKSQTYDMREPRRSANYKPNIWKYDFLQSLSTKYDEEPQYEQEAKKLKEDVKRIFLEAVSLQDKLELVDKITKLGLANHFEEEIKTALDAAVASWVDHQYQNNDNRPLNLDDQDTLYTTAMCFRLLRLHGYQVSIDVFSNYMDETGHLKENKCRDNSTKALLQLFEASYVALEGENVLDEAKAFSTRILKKDTLTSFNKSDGDLLGKQHIAHALEMPSHWRVRWFDVKWQIKACLNHENHVEKISLLQLAKLNFNMIQATLRKDLKELSRWWRDLGLIGKLSFTRDRLIESFLCTVGLVYEPQYSCFRKWLTKVIIMILIIDDVYDVYGSWEELQHFTDAVDRWDMGETQQLPDCMKICFQALYDITNEMAEAMQRKNGWKHVQPHLKNVWSDFCKALLVEAKWYKQGYTPSLQEYLNNAWISSSGSVLSVHSFFAIMNHESILEDQEDNSINYFLENHQDLLYNVSLIIRLCNDLGTSTAEQERGDAASSIVCYMREKNVSEDKSRRHIKCIINKAWKRINGDQYWFSGTRISLSPDQAEMQLFVNINKNMARVVHNLYQYGDGFGVQDNAENKKQVLSILVEPFKL